MSVYVDHMQITPSGRQQVFSYPEFCHLFADTESELHVFAYKLRLNSHWFQYHELVPHYDITLNKRVVALRLGAVEVDKRFLVGVMRDRRAAKNLVKKEEKS